MPYVAIVPYADVDYGDAYFGERLGTSAWDDASDEDKLKALKQATRNIDRLNFAGVKNDEDQVRQFPRGDDTDVPIDVQNACCEEAMALLAASAAGTLGAEVSIRLTRQKIGDAEEEYDTDFVLEQTNNNILSKEAWLFLSPYFRDPRILDIDRA